MQRMRMARGVLKPLLQGVRLQSCATSFVGGWQGPKQKLGMCSHSHYLQTKPGQFRQIKVISSRGFVQILSRPNESHSHVPWFASYDSPTTSPPPRPKHRAIITWLNDLASIVGYITMLVIIMEYIRGTKVIQRDDVDLTRERVKSAVSGSTYTEIDVKHYVSRPSLEDKMKNALDRHSHSFTYLVSGPRGSGKTILVNKALKGRSSVIAIDLTPDTAVTDEVLAGAILKELQVEYTVPGLNPTTLLLPVLKDIQPILIVEVNERCTSTCLQSLLLRLKSWGADKMLVRPIVVVSSSRAAFGLTIGLNELRTRHFMVPDMMKDEAASVLDNAIKYHITKDCTKKDISHICKKVVSVLGTRPLDLAHFNSTLEETNGNLSIEAVEILLEKVIEKQSRLYRYALTTCMCEIAGKDPEKQNAFKDFVKNLHNGPVQLNHIIWQTFGLSNKNFINIIEGIHPHPFYVLLGENQVYLGNAIVKHIDVESLKYEEL